MLQFLTRHQSPWPDVAGYAAAIVTVGIAIAGLSLMQARWQTAAHVSILLLAVIVTTRLGGPKAGLLATLLAIVGFSYLMHLRNPLADPGIQVVRLVSLAVVACYVVWVTAAERRRAAAFERLHREALRNNEALRTENIERKRTEEELRANQRLLAQVLATLPVGVSVTDQKGDVTIMNAAIQRIWGDPVIVSGAERWQRSKGAWHQSGNSIAPSEWASVRALKTGATTLNELIDIESSTGEQKTIQNSAAPIRSAKGQIVGAVVVNEDVTERVRADEALRESADRLQHLSRRLLAVQEEERRHLSRELHDEFGQLLATITLHLQAAKSAVGPAAQSSLEEGIVLLQRAAGEVRSLALELRPTLLETAGLETTLRWLAEQYQQRTGIAAEVVGHVTDVLGEAAIAGFRVVQEALTNVVRHAGARHVWIELGQSEGVLSLVVRDDGVGFDASKTLERAPERGNLGLLGIRERVQILGGSLAIDSRPGRGTRIGIALPVAEAAAVPAQQTA